MNIRIFSMVILLTLSTSSCKKFLEPVPNDFLSPDAYYTNLGQLDYARAGVYSILGSLGFYGSYANYLFAFAGDEGYMNRFTLTTGPWNYNFSPAEPFSTAFWTTMYNGINRANVLLANIDKNEGIVKNNRDVIRGEILFLRGYFYFQLVQYYGGVPLKLEPTLSINNVDIPRSTVKQVYDQILKDMTAAEPLVDNINAIGHAGRVSKSAVRGFLAKVCLFMAGEPLKETGRYQESVKWAKMVIDDAQAGHALNPSFPDIFIRLASDRYDIKESIWEVEFWGNRQDSYIETTNNGHINGPANGPTAPNNNTGRADAYMWSTSKLYNVFEPGDNRKFMSLAFFTYNSTGPNGSKTYISLPANDLAKWTLTPAKFRREYEVLLPKNGTQTPQNVPLLRFADVLLMYAEALNEVSGPTNDAIAAVNQVRRRGWAKGIKTIQITNGGSGYTSLPTVTFTGGGGTIDAVATATLIGDRVTSITLNRDSVSYYRMGRYNSVPAINISGGGGSSATAIATIYSPDEADVTSANTASKDAFKKFLQDERMRELSFESSRKADLLRWGIFLDVMRDMGIKAQQEIPNNPAVKYFTNVLPKHLLLPIPANEQILNKAIGQNNPGWD